MIIRRTDLRKIGYCRGGSQKFAQRYGLDWVDFIKNGIDSDDLIRRSNNDGLAIMAVSLLARTSKE